jgi:hypothetical protein
MSPPIGPVERSSPAISRNGLVYFGSMDGQIYCLTESSGTLAWNYPIGGQIQASPTITDDHIIIGSLNGDLYNFGPILPTHDIAVLNVQVSKTITSAGRNITITYTVVNNGNTAEDITVTIGYNITQAWTPPNYNETTLITIDRTTIPTGLPPTTRTIQWNTTGLDYGYYTISVNAIPIEGESTITDNEYTDGTVMISVQGDVNGDGIVNVFDILTIKANWGETPPIWNPNVDCNDDDIINVFDILTVKAHWGQSW